MFAQTSTDILTEYMLCRLFEIFNNATGMFPLIKKKNWFPHALCRLRIVYVVFGPKTYILPKSVFVLQTLSTECEKLRIAKRSYCESHSNIAFFIRLT